MSTVLSRANAIRTGKPAREQAASATPPKVGYLLRNLRLARRLTLDELAKSSEVSKSVLSQIERDRTNPTVGTLWRLAKALGVEIEDLLRVDTRTGEYISRVKE